MDSSLSSSRVLELAGASGTYKHHANRLIVEWTKNTALHRVIVRRYQVQNTADTDLNYVTKVLIGQKETELTPALLC